MHALPFYELRAQYFPYTYDSVQFRKERVLVLVYIFTTFFTWCSFPRVYYGTINFCVSGISVQESNFGLGLALTVVDRENFRVVESVSKTVLYHSTAQSIRNSLVSFMHKKRIIYSNHSSRHVTNNGRSKALIKSFQNRDSHNLSTRKKSLLHS